jgi:hypothetical protein
MTEKLRERKTISSQIFIPFIRIGKILTDMVYLEYERSVALASSFARAVSTTPGKSVVETIPQVATGVFD